MNADEIERRLKSKILRPNGQRRIGVLVGDTETRVNSALYGCGLARRYAAEVSNKRLFILDKWTMKPVLEVLLDIVRGSTGNKAFVYGLMVIGADGKLSPAPLQLKRRQ